MRASSALVARGLNNKPLRRKTGRKSQSPTLKGDAVSRKNSDRKKENAQVPLSEKVQSRDSTARDTVNVKAKRRNLKSKHFAGGKMPLGPLKLDDVSESSSENVSDSDSDSDSNGTLEAENSSESGDDSSGLLDRVSMRSLTSEDRKSKSLAVNGRKEMDKEFDADFDLVDEHSLDDIDFSQNELDSDPNDSDYVSVGSFGDGSSNESDDLSGNSSEDVDDDSDADLKVDISKNANDAQKTGKWHATGDSRTLDDEIDAGYGSDSSTDSVKNTIGSTALLEKYMQMPHIGYDIEGKRIMRPASASSIEALIQQIEHSDLIGVGGASTLDIETGLPIKLSKEEASLLKRVSENMIPDDLGFNPYPDYVDWFTSKVRDTPISQLEHEPKRRSLPSKHEQKRIRLLIKAIKAGHIKFPSKDEAEQLRKEKIARKRLYDLWKDQIKEKKLSVMDLKAPKLRLPCHSDSYNPPDEYVASSGRKYSALRLVPAWKSFVKDRFERCLDLYLATRTRKKEILDPESLIPKLPLPSELKPFPEIQNIVFKGHKGRVRSCNFGNGVLASGGDDCILRFWDIGTGRNVLQIDMKETIETIAWNPSIDLKIIAVACGDNVHLVVPSLFSQESVLDSVRFLNQDRDQSASAAKKSSARWEVMKLKQFEASLEAESGQEMLVATISTKQHVKRLQWHRRGDYIASVGASGDAQSIHIHQTSQRLSQHPFASVKGTVQLTKFHPNKPWLFVASQQYVRIFDLAKSQLLRILRPGVKWISCMDIHPSGDHVIVGSYDSKVIWHDLDAGDKPYRVFRFHSKAVRATAFHATKPLLATCSDDGIIRIFHVSVSSDMMQPPLIVPLKAMQSNQSENRLGVLDATWTDLETVWLATAGANGSVKLWT